MTSVWGLWVFVQAAIQALRKFPAVNAEIDGDVIIYKIITILARRWYTAGPCSASD